MTKKTNPKPALTRRRVLVAGAAAAGAATLSGAPVLAATPAADRVAWSPRLLSAEQASLLTRLCDLLLPRTATPGAVDAGVPEWIDLAVSLAEPSEQLEFLGGLGWIDQRASNLHGDGFLSLAEPDQIARLAEISDETEEHAENLKAGAAFFADLKRRTLFAFFTSQEGRTEVLGRPAKVQREEFHGCAHESHRKA